VKLTDVSALLNIASVTDSVLPRLDEARSIIATLSRADSLSLTLTELRAIFATLNRSDSVLAKVTEATFTSVIAPISDTLSPMVDEPTPGIAVVVGIEDLLSLVLEVERAFMFRGLAPRARVLRVEPEHRRVTIAIETRRIRVEPDPAPPITVPRDDRRSD
jgi:hypothetical protein